MRKPSFSICENKGTDQLRSNLEADQHLCFHYTDSTVPLLSKSEISSHLLRLHSRFVSDLEILTSIKGHNSVANLRNLSLYNRNLDIINVNVYTKFG